ncbi:hypothetical protein LCGC14_1248210 [marine sediment metagenome]|uniref:Uncharacterized protein n=1 Tax=marine sediment metagenome TaxID=412755 RepID=A0A0F9NL40_9ZZZZ
MKFNSEKIMQICKEYFADFHEKIINNKENIDLMYLFLKWGKLIFSNLRNLSKKRINFYLEVLNQE